MCRQPLETSQEFSCHWSHTDAGQLMHYLLWQCGDTGLTMIKKTTDNLRYQTLLYLVLSSMNWLNFCWLMIKLILSKSYSSSFQLCTCHWKPPLREDVGHTGGFARASMTYQPERGGGIVHFRQFILLVRSTSSIVQKGGFWRWVKVIPQK